MEMFLSSGFSFLGHPYGSRTGLVLTVRTVPQRSISVTLES
jgi:hypothetical protein